MIIRKPLPSRQHKLVMQTTGQTKINLLFTAHEYMYGQLLQRTSDHQQLGKNNGLRVLMSSPPKNETINPDGRIYEQEYDFSLTFNCSLHPDYHCAVDGDEAVAHFNLASQMEIASAPTVPNRAVTIKAKVAALPSCEKITAEVIRGAEAIPHSSTPKRTIMIERKLDGGFKVAVKVFDVDGQPIRFSLPRLNIEWSKSGGTPETLPFKRESSGSHVFTSTISPNKYRMPGQ